VAAGVLIAKLTDGDRIEKLTVTFPTMGTDNVILPSKIFISDPDERNTLPSKIMLESSSITASPSSSPIAASEIMIFPSTILAMLVSIDADPSSKLDATS